MAEGTGAGAACMHIGTTTSISNANWASVVLQCRIPAWRGPGAGGKYTSIDMLACRVRDISSGKVVNDTEDPKMEHILGWHC